MPIIEALIYRADIKRILIRCTVSPHNMDPYMNTCLKIKKRDEKLVYKLSEDFYVSMLQTEPTSLVCLHTSDFSLERTFHFLARWRKDFWKSVDDSYLSENFEYYYDELENLIIEYNKLKPITNTEILKDNLINTKDIMILNLENIEERSEKIDALKKKMGALALPNGYNNFKNERKEALPLAEPLMVTKKTKPVNRKKYAIWMSIAAIFVLSFILALNICGGYSFEEC